MSVCGCACVCVCVRVCYLWDSVRRRVHELSEVHHALPLVLGDMDALDRGETRISVPEVLQLELPMGQTGTGQLHKHLAGRSRDKTVADCIQTIILITYQKISASLLERCCYLVLEKNNELRAEDETTELCWLKQQKKKTFSNHVYNHIWSTISCSKCLYFMILLLFTFSASCLQKWHLKEARILSVYFFLSHSTLQRTSTDSHFKRIHKNLFKSLLQSLCFTLGLYL